MEDPKKAAPAGKAALVKVKNYAEHEFHLPNVTGVGKVEFPRLGMRTGKDGNSDEVPGEVEVSQAVIDRMNEHPVTRSWFGNDPRGRRQLVIEPASGPVQKTSA